MSKQRSILAGDQTPVTGGSPLPAYLTASPMDDEAPDDDLGRQAYWLLKLHADAVSPKFDKMNLSAMSDDAKRRLIAEIQRALGVEPLKSEIL